MERVIARRLNGVLANRQNGTGEAILGSRLTCRLENAIGLEAHSCPLEEVDQCLAVQSWILKCRDNVPTPILCGELQVIDNVRDLT